MMRRIPLWLTLLPLVAAVGLYWLLWSGWARDFDGVVRHWLPAADFGITGFPYRLEAEVAGPLVSGGDVVKLFAGAQQARINRGPWQPELTVIGTRYPRFSAIIGPGLGASFSGKSAMTSIKVVDGRLVRLSTTVEAANARLGFAPVAIAADALELHVRERRPAKDGEGGATLPPRGQLVIAGQRIRFDKGDALTLAADMVATGAGRLLGFDQWATTGTIEVTNFSLSDAHGEVAGITATLVPTGRTSLRFAGTIETICPASVAAAFDGRAAPAEKRLRAPLRLAFEGVPGALRLTGVPSDLAQRAVRGQMPPCPVLRGRRAVSAP
ncbi:MAG: hypothetical protein ACOYLS_09170 [Polymorphobacter sp.]